MRTRFIRPFALLLAVAGSACGQAEDYFTNYVRQVQLPS